MGVNMQQSGPTFAHAIAKCGLDPCLIIKAVAIDNFEDQMRARENAAIAANEVVIACVIEHATVSRKAVSVFRMGACLQTSPQLEEVGARHSTPPSYQQIDVVGP